MTTATKLTIEAIAYDSSDMPVFNICEINTEVKVSKPPFNKLVLVYSLKVRITTNAQALKTPALI